MMENALSPAATRRDIVRKVCVPRDLTIAAKSELHWHPALPSYDAAGITLTIIRRE